MRVFLSLLGLCAASEIVFRHEPKNLKISKKSAVSGDVAIDIHRVATGKAPKHILTEDGSFQIDRVQNPWCALFELINHETIVYNVMRANLHCNWPIQIMQTKDFGH